MNVYSSLKDLLVEHRKSKLGIAIGNFDGVHLGHQKFIKDAKEHCSSNNLSLVVITFNPHPRKILKAATGFLINSYVDRRSLLKACGVDHLIEIEFTRDFSTLSPGEFLDDYVLLGHGVKTLFLGYDFAFGANKTGDHKFVKDYCESRSVDFYIESQFKESGATISSTEIRKLISGGKMLDVANLLGRHYFLRGTIVKGEGRGKKIGFPTANMEILDDLLIPRTGVYASRVTYNEMVYFSITNVGVKPTFNKRSSICVETFIFDFDEDIYGETLQVEFIDFLRDEKKFDSVNSLISQLKYDVDKTKKYFKI